MDWSFGWFSGKKSQEQLAGELKAAKAEKEKITENCNAQQKTIDEKIAKITAEITSATTTSSAVAGDVKVNVPEQKQETSASNPAIKPSGGGKRRKQKSSKKVRGGKRKNTRRK